MILFLLLAACGQNTSADAVEASDPGARLMVDAHASTDRGIYFDEFFFDADKDGFGAFDSGLMANRIPMGYVEVGGDCNDTDAAVNPDATEVSNGVDDNCDRTIDEDADSDSGDTATDSGTPTDTGADSGAPIVTGIQLSWDGTGGSFPATLYAWYGASSSAFGSVTSASDSMNFAPTTADQSNHPWVDVQVSTLADTSWSSDCSGISVSSSDLEVALYEAPGVGTGCRVYVGLSVPSGGDVGTWTLVP